MFKREMKNMLLFVFALLLMFVIKTDVKAGDNLSTATPIRIGDTIYGSVQWGKEYYKFSLDEINKETKEVKLYNSSGREIDSFVLP